MHRTSSGEDNTVMSLEVSIGKLRLKNPVMTASGTFGYGEEFAEFVSLDYLGAIVVKGISLKPMEGNPPPRICETPCGMLNAIGLQNVGLKVFLKEKLPFLKKYHTPVVVNILGNSVSEYVKLAQFLDDAGVEAIELNVSCPNVKKGGIIFGTDRKILGKLVAKVRTKVKNAVLITKLSPNVTDIRSFARTAEEEGSDAISLINTIPGIAVDIRTRRPKIKNVTGGLSGPAIKPIAVRMVYEAYTAVKIPVIGMGGIMNVDDALEFMIAGATAISVGTANFINPRVTAEIVDGLTVFMSDENLATISSVTGTLDVG